jgi:hypothetical protein
MLVGVGVFMSNSVVTWRDLPFRVKHGWVKLLHAFLNVCALLFIALGLYVTFDTNSSPHFVTFHSWAALFGLLFVGVQATGGILVYLFPVVPLRTRELMLPKHAAMVRRTRRYCAQHTASAAPNCSPSQLPVSIAL